MNGVHDMGGQQGMGPVEYEKNEPVFHAPWEARVYALTRAMRAWRKWNLDTDRHALELLPPVDYLRMSYYERWVHRLAAQVVQYGLVTQRGDGERKGGSGLNEGHSGVQPRDVFPLAQPGNCLEPGSNRFDRRSRCASACAPATSIPPATRACHGTRAARPASSSEITASIIFPDTNAHFQGEKRQHVYSVRFAARELWGETASPRDSVHLDLWDDYLERA